jgi:hypothetical protein
MLQRPNKDRKMNEDRFIAVARPAESDGIGRALQVAFRDGYDLPSEFQDCLKRLDRVRY